MFAFTVNQRDIDNYENQIGNARAESARCGEQLEHIQKEWGKRSREKEKLQGDLVNLFERTYTPEICTDNLKPCS